MCKKVDEEEWREWSRRDNEEKRDGQPKPHWLVRLQLWMLSVFVALLCAAYATATLWAWFVVPLGAPGIGYAHAFGLSFFWKYLSFERGKGDKDDDLPVAVRAVRSVVLTALVLGLGWLAKEAMAWEVTR